MARSTKISQATEAIYHGARAMEAMAKFDFATASEHEKESKAILAITPGDNAGFSSRRTPLTPQVHVRLGNTAYIGPAPTMSWTKATPEIAKAYRIGSLGVGAWLSGKRL